MKKILLIVLFVTSVYNVKSFSQWFQAGQTVRGEYITNISVPDSNTVWISWINPDYSSNLLRTTNGGQNWSFVPLPGNGFFLTCSQGIDAQTAIVGMGTENSVLWRTSNAGISWDTLAKIPGSEAYFDEISFSKSNPQFGYAVGDRSGEYFLFKTFNRGQNWNQFTIQNIGLYPSYLSGFAVDSIFFGFQVIITETEFDTYITSDGGLSWYRGFSVTNGFGGLAFNDNKLDGIYTSFDFLPMYDKSDDGGLSWQVRTLNADSVGENYPVWVSGTNTVFLNSRYDIYRSDNNGDTWISQYHDSSDMVLHIDYSRYGNIITAYAICLNGKILKSRQTVTTGIHNISSEMPAGYSLSQNYPNPFNPATKINFSIPKSENVKLKVFDISGRLISEMVNEKLSAGIYEYELKGINLASGTYFYRLEAGDLM